MKQSLTSMIPKEMPIAPPEPVCRSRGDWRRVLQERFRQYKAQISKNGARGQLDLDNEMLKRRTRVLLDNIETIETRYRDLGECFSDKNVLGNAWLWLNIPFITYSHLECESHLLFAASIWILDQIDDSDMRSNLLQLLSFDASMDNSLSVPDAWDSQNDELLTRNVMQVLYNRHSDYKEPEYDPDTGSRKVLTDSINASGIQIESCPSMDRYRALLSLIPKEVVQTAVSRFRDKVWAWTDRYFRCQFPLMQAVKRAEESNYQARIKYNKLRSEFVDLVSSMEKLCQGQSDDTQYFGIGSPFMSPVPTLPISDLYNNGVSGRLSPSQRFMKYKENATSLSQEIDRLAATIDVLNRDVIDSRQKYQDFWMQIIRSGSISKKRAVEDFGEEVAAAIEPIIIDNPYELCFALLYLIEDGDDLPWIYGAGIGFMQEVIGSLPWGIYPYSKKENSGSPLPSKMAPLATHSFYERCYQYTGKECENTIARNLAQVVYEETGCLLPRNLSCYESAVENIEQYGVQEKEAESVLSWVVALSNVRKRRRTSNSETIELTQFFQEKGRIYKAGHPPLSYDELSVKVQQQKEQIKVLQSLLHEAEQAAVASQKELLRIKEHAALEHRELADLRERLFLNDTTEEPPAETIEDERFPYEVIHNTLVFGGHSAWAKGIRRLLTGSVRFLDKDKSFDSGMIRFADIIWIQTNALSHSMYYTVIDEARKLNKSVRYFLFSGAVKCAVQLAEFDRTQKK